MAKCTKVSKLKLVSGSLLILCGVCTIIWTPVELILDEILRMRPGLPTFYWWKHPPAEVLFNFYIFNITNAERFLNGSDDKLNLQEVGPIVFREVVSNTNPKYNDNGTMTFVSKRQLILLPEKNHIDLNQTITVLNPVLGIASNFWDSPFFEKWAFNMLMKSANSNCTVDVTIYNYMWNFTDPVIERAQNIVPYMVPAANMAVLSNIFDHHKDNVTAFIGKESGPEKFLLINKYDGSEYLPGFGDSCEDKIINTSEGVIYPQYINKNTSISIWRKPICKALSLQYNGEENVYGINCYKFRIPENAYDRTKPEDKDCYKSEPTLPNGFVDLSKCFYNVPLAASFPHFLHPRPGMKNNVNGMAPDVEKHDSEIYIEPLTGIPVTGKARVQGNMVLRKLEGFSEEIDRFSDMIVPIFWIDFRQDGLPWYIAGLLFFLVRVMPILQRVVTALLLISGAILVIFGQRGILRSKPEFLSTNKQIRFEQEAFLKI